MTTITIANLKGGSGKTTSAAFLAHAYAERGKRVLLVDADPQGSALRWSEHAAWTIPTLSLPVKDLHRRLPGIVGSDIDVVIIDSPPLDEHTGVVYSALRAANQLLVPLAPTMAEFERLSDLWSAVEETDALRDGPLSTAVLLNRVVPRASSTGIIRNLIADSGHLVLSTAIHRLEAIAQAFGAPIIDPGRYRDVALELEASRTA